MKVKSESEVAQSCPTRSNPMDCSHPGASIHGIFQAEVLEWGATAFSETIYKCPLTKLLCVNLIYFLHLHIKSVECRTCQLKLSINIYTNSKVTQYYLPTLLTKSKVKSMNFNIWLITTFLSTNMVYFPLKHKLTKVAYEFVLWFRNSFRDIPKENADLCDQRTCTNLSYQLYSWCSILEITQIWMSDKNGVYITIWGISQVCSEKVKYLIAVRIYLCEVQEHIKLI